LSGLVCNFLISLKKTSVFSGQRPCVVIIKTSRPKQKKKKKFPCGGTIFWEQTFRFVTPKGTFLKRHEGGLGQDFFNFPKGPFGTECGNKLKIMFFNFPYCNKLKIMFFNFPEKPFPWTSPDFGPFGTECGLRLFEFSSFYGPKSGRASFKTREGLSATF
jgi:hypothetical protein